MARVLALAAATCSLVVNPWNGAAEDGSSTNVVEPGKTPLYERMRIYREQMRNAPGRTGILAEKRMYSAFDEELIIRDFFEDREGGFFLDVGCAWPIKASNTYYLEKNLGWSGIGVDALDDYAAGWKKERPVSKFFSYLVTDKSGGTGTFFRSPTIGLSSTERDRAAGKNFGDTMEPTKIEIPRITLNDLLDREGIERIDLLSMDIEGHELKALAGFDLARFRPELIVVEGPTWETSQYLYRHGYVQIKRYVPFDPVNRYFHREPAPRPRP